jgi:hypothetical protein
MQFDRGYISPYFVTNAEKMRAELDDPPLLQDRGVCSGSSRVPTTDTPCTYRFATLAGRTWCVGHGPLVLAVGCFVHRPLTRLPENSLKFIGGLLLWSLGLFCTGLDDEFFCGSSATSGSDRHPGESIYLAAAGSWDRPAVHRYPSCNRLAHQGFAMSRRGWPP